ncbi:peptidyl-prolyl cis-trans isomerase G-like [Haliotis rufescens]|uniref:peptidyl-prolyl cis-trans isomerase G-like n=1 Tax=Haliotis rufescens TaxID=6454 RepID=UPI00201EE21C|nr:peptidyl-prolyl cis-trans isomerase G-like [Haliotis rufescens]
MDDPWGDDDDDGILAQAVDKVEEVFFAEDDDDDWLLSQSLAEVEEQLQLDTSHSHSSQTDHQRSNRVPQTNSAISARSESHFSKDTYYLNPEYEKGALHLTNSQQRSSHDLPSSTITSMYKTSTPNSKQPSPPSTSGMRKSVSNSNNMLTKPSSSHSTTSDSKGQQQKKMHKTQKTSVSETFPKRSQQHFEKNIFDQKCGVHDVAAGLTKEPDSCSESGGGAEGLGPLSGTSGNRNSGKDMEEELQKQKQSLERVKNTLDSELQCSICNELFVQATSLNCAHAFCALCISQWMKTSKNCPMCRTNITSKNRSLVLDSFIDKMCEQLGEEMREDRKALLVERKNEQAKFDDANPPHHQPSRGQTRTASPPHTRYDRPWQHHDDTSSISSFTDSDYSEEYWSLNNRNFERDRRDSDSWYSTDSSATDFSDHSPRSRQRRRDMRHRERRRTRQHRRGRHSNSDSSMSTGRREDWRRRRRREEERRQQTDEHSDEDSGDSHDEESLHGRDRRRGGRRRRARIESSSEDSDWENDRHATVRHTRRRNSHDRERSRSRERSNNRRQGHAQRRIIRSDDEDVDNGGRGGRASHQHTDNDGSYQSTTTASSQGSTSSTASVPGTSRVRPTRASTSYGRGGQPRRTQLINPRPESRRSFYGGYGKCYKCGRSGHWANGCSYR